MSPSAAGFAVFATNGMSAPLSVVRNPVRVLILIDAAAPPESLLADARRTLHPLEQVLFQRWLEQRFPQMLN